MVSLQHSNDDVFVNFRIPFLLGNSDFVEYGTGPDLLFGFGYLWRMPSIVIDDSHVKRHGGFP